MFNRLEQAQDAPPFLRHARFHTITLSEQEIRIKQGQGRIGSFQPIPDSQPVYGKWVHIHHKNPLTTSQAQKILAAMGFHEQIAGLYQCKPLLNDDGEIGLMVRVK